MDPLIVPLSGPCLTLLEKNHMNGIKNLKYNTDYIIITQQLSKVLHKQKPQRIQFRNDLLIMKYLDILSLMEGNTIMHLTKR